MVFVPSYGELPRMAGLIQSMPPGEMKCTYKQNDERKHRHLSADALPDEA